MFELRKPNVQVQIHAEIVEQEALDQIKLIESHPAFNGLVAIMPDVHAGAGCVIGFTGRFRNAVIPNIIGVDIGCGVAAYPLHENTEIDFNAFDKYARASIPLGFNSRNITDMTTFAAKEPTDALLRHTNFRHDLFDSSTGMYWVIEKARDFLHTKITGKKIEPTTQLATLGGGNHFIEIDEDQDGRKYIVVHTGSRNFGLKVANYYQKMARELCEAMSIEVPKGLEYLPMTDGYGKAYMKDMKTAQDYARLNRRFILEILLKHFNVEIEDVKYIESTHNYISERDHIIRKGAISAHKGERVIIPLNMSDGIIIGRGKGVSKYNYSAPHGAGRMFGRKEMYRRLERGEVSMKEFEDKMGGIFSTSVSEATFDESPMAYKPVDKVMEFIKETVEVEAVLKPVYNLKDDTKKKRR